MTVFRTQLKLINQTTAKDIWSTFCLWTIGTAYHKSATLVSYCKKNANNLINLQEQFHNEKDKSIEKLSVLYFDEVELFYIIFSQDYDNGNRYETTIVFNGLEASKYLSYETNVFGPDERKIKFTKSNFFNYLKDFLRKENLEKRYYKTNELKDLSSFSRIMKHGSSLLPFVYISQRNDGSYPYSDSEISELAKQLYCCAFVIKESDIETSKVLKNKTNGINAYNGAVGIYAGTQRRIYFDKNINQITDKITKLLCLNPLNEKVTVTYVKNFYINRTRKVLIEFSNKFTEELSKPGNIEMFLSGMNKKLESPMVSKNKSEDSKVFELQQNLEDYKKNVSELEKKHNEEISNLKEEYEKKLRDKDEWIGVLDDDNQEKDSQIADLHTQIEGLSAQLETYKSRFETNHSKYTININCSEPELFAGEISDYLNGLIYETFRQRNNSPLSNRERDVICKLLPENEALDWDKSKSCMHYANIKKDIVKNGHSALYQKKRDSGHHITEFYGDSRYGLTEAGTLSDKVRGKQNLASCAEQHFLKPCR